MSSFIASDNEVDAMDRVVDYVIGDFKRLETQQRYRTDPKAWAWDKLGVYFHDRQTEIGLSVVHNRNTAVAAGHGTGKSFQAAILAAWWVDTHPLGTAYVATTAPTNDQISEIIFRELKRIHSMSAERVAKGIIPKDWGLPGRVGEDNTWKIERSGRLVTVMKGRKPPDNKAGDAFQGLHARYVLAIGDEATGLTEEMIDGLANITSGEHNRRLLISNPTNPYSYLGRIFLKPTGAWNLINVSVFDLPTFHGGGVCEKRGCKEHVGEKLGLGFPKDILESISGPRFVKDKEKEYGLDSARYKSRVLGQWAFEAGSNLFTEEDMYTATDTVVEPFFNETPILGVDVARFGTDSTYVYRADRGLVMRRKFSDDPDSGAEEREPALDDDGQNIIGTRLRYQDSWLDAPLVTRTMPDGKTTMGTAERVDQIARTIGCREVRVDVSGLGGGVVDRLWELSEGGKHYIVVEMLGGANSPDRRSWYNQRAFQLDGNLRLGMFQGRIDIDARDENLIDELMGVQYEYADAASGGGLKIESKESIKRRGGKSPDAVDAAWYATANLDHLNAAQPGDVLHTDFDSVIDGERGWFFDQLRGF